MTRWLVPGLVAVLTGCVSAHVLPPRGGRTVLSIESDAWRTCIHREPSSLYCWGRRSPGPDETSPQLIVEDLLLLPSSPLLVGAVYIDIEQRWAVAPTPGIEDRPGSWVGGPVVETTRAVSGVAECVSNGSTLRCWGWGGRWAEVVLPDHPTAIAAGFLGTQVYIVAVGAFGALRWPYDSDCDSERCAILGRGESLTETPMVDVIDGLAFLCGVPASGPLVHWHRLCEDYEPRAGELPEGLVHIDGDLYHVCGLDGTGLVWCWGQSGLEERGLHPGAPIPRPETVDWPAPRVIVLPEEATDIAVGRYHACALLADDSIWCWGSNVHGQLGDGTLVDSVEPVRVVGLP